MNKKAMLLTGIMLTGTLLFVGCGASKEQKTPQKDAPSGKQQAYFTTGTPGGVFQLLGTGMAKIINEKVSGLEVVPTTPAQMQQTASMLETGKAKLGIGMLCMFERAYDGVEEYAGKPHTKLRQVVGMYDNVFAYVVMKGNNKINGIDDFPGKTMATTAANITSTMAVVKAAGYEPKTVKYRSMSYNQSMEALSDGTADLSMMTGFPKNGGLDSLASTRGIRLMGLNDTTRAKFDKDNPNSRCLPVPAGTYAGQDKEIWGPVVYSALYASIDMPEEQVYQITKAIIENNLEISKIHPAGKDITLGTTKRYLESNLMKPERMHPGAVRYFKEQGVIK